MVKKFAYNDKDPRSFQEQFNEWKLIGDTHDCDLSSYPGRGEEQAISDSKPRVVTKRGKRK